MIRIESARPEHAKEIIANLREGYEDVPESEKIVVYEIESASRAFVGFIDEELVCLWGVCVKTILGGAYLWLLATKRIEDRPFVFVRHSQLIARELLKEYSFLYGYVLKSNAQSIRWLKWLGCTVYESEHPELLKFRLRSS